MDNKPAISVLIPVYNGKDYLRQTIENLQRQTFTDFEVVCVDDLSTDNSVEILNEFASKDSRIKVIERDTKGGYAVSGIIYGLPYTSGEYYFFMSQDDFLSEDCLEKTYNRAVETGADAVLPDLVWYQDDGEDHGGIYPINKDYDLELSPRKAFALSLNWKIHGCALKKMGLVKELGYDDLFYNSCEYANRRFYLHSNKVVFSKGTFYYRQDNPNAITKNLSWFSFEGMGTDLRLLNQLFENNYDRKTIDKFLRKVTNTIKYWKKDYKENAHRFTPEQCQYVKNLMEKSEKEIIKISLKNKKYFNLLNLYIRNLMV